MTNGNESWKISPRFPSYEVSNLGRVRRYLRYNNSTPTGLIKVTPYGKFGYQRVSISEGNIRCCMLLHRLVAETFFGACPVGYVVNHIDADKSNNAIDNLEYVTPRENIDHAKALRRYRAWNKGLKTNLVSRSAFKLGHRPWNATLS